MGLILETMNLIDTAVQSYVAGVFAKVSAPIKTVLQASGVVGLGFMAVNSLFQFKPIQFSEYFNWAVKYILILMMATVWANFEPIYNIVTNVPAEYGGAILDSTGLGAGGNLNQQLDAFAGTVFKIGGAWMKKGSLFNLLPKIIGVLIMVLGAFLVVAAVLIMAIGKIGLAMAMSLAPIFIATLVFRQTSDLFSTWTKFALGFASVPMVMAGIMGVMLGLSKTFLDQATDANKLQQIMPLILILLACIFLIWQIPQLVQALSGSMMGGMGVQNIGGAINRVRGGMNTAKGGVQRGLSAGHEMKAANKAGGSAVNMAEAALAGARMNSGWRQSQLEGRRMDRIDKNAGRDGDGNKAKRVGIGRRPGPNALAAEGGLVQRPGRNGSSKNDSENSRGARNGGAPGDGFGGAPGGNQSSGGRPSGGSSGNPSGGGGGNTGGPSAGASSSDSPARTGASGGVSGNASGASWGAPSTGSSSGPSSGGNGLGQSNQSGGFGSSNSGTPQSSSAQGSTPATGTAPTAGNWSNKSSDRGVTNAGPGDLSLAPMAVAAAPVVATAAMAGPAAAAPQRQAPMQQRQEPSQSVNQPAPVASPPAVAAPVTRTPGSSPQGFVPTGGSAQGPQLSGGSGTAPVTTNWSSRSAGAGMPSGSGAAGTVARSGGSGNGASNPGTASSFAPMAMAAAPVVASAVMSGSTSAAPQKQAAAQRRKDKPAPQAAPVMATPVTAPLAAAPARATSFASGGTARQASAAPSGASSSGAQFTPPKPAPIMGSSAAGKVIPPLPPTIGEALSGRWPGTTPQSSKAKAQTARTLLSKTTAVPRRDNFSNWSKKQGQ